MRDTSAAARIAQSHRAEIIDTVYEVAVDPARFESLIDIWERRLAPLRPSDAAAIGGGFRDAELETHLARASLVIERFDASSTASGLGAALTEFGRKAAFVSEDGRSVVASNAAAAQVFGLDAGCGLQALPIEPEDVAVLGAMIRDVVSGRRREPALIRAHSPRTGSPFLMRVAPLRDGTRRLAVVVTTELAWPDALSETMREAFDLTTAEVEVVRSIVEGKQLRDIAHERGRSAETVRTQLRSVLAKTETHSQSELIRVTMGLMDVVGLAERGRPIGVVPAAGSLARIPFATMRLSDGRRYDYIAFGDPNGRPCLFLPQGYGLSRWPASAEAAAARRGIRVIVPVRAGYGHSSPLPPDVDYCRQTAADLLALLDHLGIGQAAVLSLSADFRYALRLALLAPDRVTGIFGCSAALPIRTRAQYERMDKWQRFILANARYAPAVLPFLVKAGYSMARRLGKVRFFSVVNGGSNADIRTFADPEVREAVICGSDICLGDWHSAHEAFAREAIDTEVDWSWMVRACPVPVRLLQGAQDPQFPAETIRELMGDFPSLRVDFVDQAGQLLFFQEWRRVLDELEPMLPAAVLAA